MGNTHFTSVCRRDEALDFEDISDATFDFISVAVNKHAIECSRMVRGNAERGVHEFVPNKAVAVVPVPIQDPMSPSPSPCYSADSKREEEGLSFNERLNLLTWDPESMPTYAKRQELYVFDEYAMSPIHVAEAPRKELTHQRRGWIRRAVDAYKERRERQRQQRDIQDRRKSQMTKTTTVPYVDTPTPPKTKKRSLHMTLWSRRQKRSMKERPYQLPTQDTIALLDNEEEERFLVGGALPKCKNAQWSIDKVLADPVSDTESDDSGSDTTPNSLFLTNFHEGYANTWENDADSDWESASSTSTCYFSAPDESGLNRTQSNGLDEDDTTSFFSSSEAMCMRMTDYLDKCSDDAQLMEISREVTNSNSWMNEAERRALCRILQAYSTYNPKMRFQKAMIGAAEECLLVFHGDEEAAFNAFVMLDSSHWD